MPPIPFENAYVTLGERFYARVTPTPVARPEVLRVNVDLARQLGIDPDGLTAEVLAGNVIPEGGAPLAMAYAGHQFGGFVPRLGDGRAILLGEVRDASGVAWDIQLKGSGRTPFSRGGDGRAWLGPALREYVVSEAMHALGVPTTRALAVVATGESVRRERALPGAVLTRVAHSHVRVGTFEYFAAQGDIDALAILVDHVLARHLPEVEPGERPALALLAEVSRRQAALIAQWLSFGFVHGVMNTDNSSVVGDTIDYGPCAFLDEYDPHKKFSSIDRQGRYAYGNQAHIAHWNLGALARALVPLLGPESVIEAAQAVLDAFPAAVQARHLERMRAKIGLATERPGDQELIDDLLARMADNQADFTLTFRALCDVTRDGGDHAARARFRDPTAFDAWAVQWRARLAAEGSDDAPRRAAMRATNPVYIPRNHRIEQMIDAAVAGDLGPLDALCTVLARPYEESSVHPELARPPEPSEVVVATFCGT